MRTAKFLMATTAMALCATAARADLNISNKATQNVSCSGGVCTATAAKAVLNAGDLANMLASGDVAVKTGGGATNILVRGAVSWTSTSRLTLDANQTIEIESPVSVTGTGAVTITTNDGGSGGDLMFNGNGHLKFWNTTSSLVIDHKSYTLIDTIKNLQIAVKHKTDGHFALASNYNASHDGVWRQPVPRLDGTLEGLGNVISHLSISFQKEVGLVGENHGVVRDIGLAGVNLTEKRRAAVMGALVVYNLGTVTRSYASGQVRAGQSTGGLVGVNEGVISWSHAATTVLGGPAGGLVSFTHSSYSTGLISGVLAGGFAGEDDSLVIGSSYWDLDTSGINNTSQGAGQPANDPGITGLTDVQLKSGLPPGFDSAVWGQDPNINSGYPYLLAIPPK